MKGINQMTGPDTVLNIENLTTTFGDLKAVDGLDLQLQKGKTLGIVGESGSGKSMTALSIMGLVPKGGRITSGKIELIKDEKAVNLTELSDTEMTPYRGKEIGLIFQEPFSAFNPSYRCGYQIKESVDLHLQLSRDEAYHRIIDELSRVGIHDPERIYRSYPHELSGGQLQRALIALAIVCRPRIIIADEPTTALDVTVQKEVLGLFKELVEELDASMIFISHDLGVVSEIADEVLVMYRGRKMEQGSMSSIFKSPGHPYTKGLLACRPRMDRRASRLPVVSDFMTVIEKGQDWVVEAKNETTLLDDNHTGARTTSDDQPIIKVEGFNVRYPSSRNLWGGVTKYVDAVKDANFEIFSGETLGLVGESGSGKSSLGKGMLKLVENCEGSVEYKGMNILEITNREMRPLRKDLQIIFQDPFSTLNPRMKIGKAINEVLQVHGYDGDRKDRVIELLEKVGMEASHYNRYPQQFSGGQRQRISIARTLAVEPKFVVCDESVSALDVSVQAQILNLLKDLQDELGLSYLFISHDLSVVKHMSDRLMVMQNGEIVESGLAQDVYNHPQQNYTKQLISAIPGFF